MKMKKFVEGKAVIFAPSAEKVSRELEVFYNPTMKQGRDVAVALLAALGRKKLRMLDLLAGTGIRSIRFMKELSGGTIAELTALDANPKAFALMKKNFAMNKVKANILHSEANKFLTTTKCLYDYIDIDPFGSPNNFLDAAVKRLAKNGMLAVTATDTSALAGTSLRACLRKYWAVPLRNELMHETGCRVLARKAQLVAAQYEIALTPVYCHSTLHFTRLYFIAGKGNVGVSRVLKHHLYFHYCTRCLSRAVSKENEGECVCGHKMAVAGPLWAGRLWDKHLASKMTRDKLMQTIAEEAKVDAVGFFDTHRFCKNLKLNVPPLEEVISLLRKKGFKAARTHFLDSAVRSDCKAGDFIVVIRQLSSRQQH